MSTQPPLNVLLVGAGMYTCGLGTNDYGTILPSVFEGCREGLVDKVTMVGQNPAKADEVAAKVRELNKLMGLSIPVEYYPKGTDPNPKAYEALIQKKDYNCAILSFPDHLHFEVTRNLIKRGLHCLVVKPLVSSLREVNELMQLQAEHGVHCAVEFHKRFDESNLRIRKMLKENMIGDVSYVLVEYSQRKSIPLKHFRSWAEESNIFQYLGVHYVDQIYYCTGAYPQRVMAIGQKNFLCAEGVDTYDAIQVMIEWGYKDSAKRFASAILTNWIDPHITTAMSDQKIKYIGTVGRIECDQKDRGLRLVSDATGIADINPYFSDLRYNVSDSAQEFRGYGYASVIQFLRDCADVQAGRTTVAGLRGLRATFRDARVSTAVVEAVNESLSTNGRWVHLDLNTFLD